MGTTTPLQKVPSEPAKLVLLVLAALVLRIPRLTESLWYDELWSTRVILGSMGDTLRSTLIDVHPPLYSLIMFTWISLFGDSELSIRTLPLLAGVATVALMPALGGALADRTAGWIGGVLLALSPVHVWYSQEARPYALLVLVAVLLLLAWHALDAPEAGWRSRLAFIILGVLIAQLHYFAVALTAAFVIAGVLHRKHRSVAIVAMMLSIAGVASVLAVKYAMGNLTTESRYLREFDLAAIVTLLVDWVPRGNVQFGMTPLGTAARWSVAAIFGTPALIWLLIGRNRIVRQRWDVHLLAMIAVPGLLVTLLLLGRQHYYIERATLPSLPLYFLAVAAGLGLLTHAPARRVAGASLVFASVAVLGVFYAQPDTWTVYKPKSDWRTLGRTISDRLSSTSGPLVIVSATPATVLAYYMPDAAECYWPPLSPPQPLPPTTVRGWIARRFEPRERQTCGVNGTARVRLYADMTPEPGWADVIRNYEAGVEALVVYNHNWPGATRMLLDELRRKGATLTLLRSGGGLELYAWH